MITEMQLVPVTADSHPFASAQFHCRLSEIDYTEEEYFLSGTANVYEEGENNRPEIIFRDAPYTTRVLIRRPADKSRFSGNVVVEVLNATAMMDIDRMWVNSWKHFTRSGDVYVGITSKGHVVDALKRFDPARYAPISWANPMPERAIPPFAKGPFPFLAQYESGLFWDMQVELARLLRSEDAKNPLAGWGKRYLYLTGWSQSGSYLCRIVKSFAYLPENTGNGPLFDGYLAAGCRADVAPMNAYEAPKTNIMHCDGWPAGSVMGAREPYININTESENRVANWIGDSDQPDFKFRTYQIPASSHDSRYSLIDYYAGQGQADCKRIGMELGWRGCEGEPLGNPFELVFNAAFRNLYAWVRGGVPAPHAPRIETEYTDAAHADTLGAWLRNKTDCFGNALGGIRTPGIDCPAGVYSSDSRTADGGWQLLFGQFVPFPAEKLKTMYGSAQQYRALVEQRADEMIAQGFLVPEDRAEMIEATVQIAVRCGL